jgi:hypothetical protein
LQPTSATSAAATPLLLFVCELLLLQGSLFFGEFRHLCLKQPELFLSRGSSTHRHCSSSATILLLLLLLLFFIELS